MDSEEVIDQLVTLFTALQVREIGAAADVLTASKATVFGEFPFDVNPEEDLTVLKSDAFTINNQPLVCAITIDEKQLLPEELQDSRSDDDTSLLSNSMFTTDYERYSFRIWMWLQFHEESARLVKRYRNAMKNLLRTTPKLGFTDDKADVIHKVGRLRTTVVELFFSKSGTVHIIGNDLDVTIIN